MTKTIGPIGLSLSFCVRDIVREKIEVEEIRFIISGCLIRSDKDFEDIIKTYMNAYWNNDPKCERVARALYGEGKVYSPRLNGNPAPNIAGGRIWADFCEYNIAKGEWEFENQRRSPTENDREWVLSEYGACPGCGDRTYHLMDGDTVLKEKCSSCGWSARTNAWFLSDRNDPEQ